MYKESAEGFTLVTMWPNLTEISKVWHQVQAKPQMRPWNIRSSGQDAAERLSTSAADVRATDVRTV